MTVAESSSILGTAACSTGCCSNPRFSTEDTPTQSPSVCIRCVRNQDSGILVLNPTSLDLQITLAWKAGKLFIVSSSQVFRLGWWVGGFGFGFIKTSSLICNSVGQQTSSSFTSAGTASTESHHSRFFTLSWRLISGPHAMYAVSTSPACYLPSLPPGTSHIQVWGGGDTEVSADCSIPMWVPPHQNTQVGLEGQPLHLLKYQWLVPLENVICHIANNPDTFVWPSRIYKRSSWIWHLWNREVPVRDQGRLTVWHPGPLPVSSLASALGKRLLSGLFPSQQGEWLLSQGLGRALCLSPNGKIGKKTISLPAT
jgi:hypothetical protein